MKNSLCLSRFSIKLLCAVMLQRLDAAEKYLKEAFRLDLSNPATAISLVLLYYQCGDYCNACFFYQPSAV